MSNRKDGNDFEAEFCEMLFSQGFWAHNMAQNVSGQPADVIAVKNGKSYLIDCKNCTGSRFTLSRIEENQKSAMNLWNKCGNGNGLFAIQICGEVYMVSANILQSKIDFGEKTFLTADDISNIGFTLSDWIRSLR